MEMLPANLTKLRWLLTMVDSMQNHDADYIKEITTALSEGHYKEACPLTLMVIDNIYTKYRTPHLEKVEIK